MFGCVDLVSMCLVSMTVVLCKCKCDYLDNGRVQRFRGK